jgi:hypothetical protein
MKSRTLTITFSLALAGSALHAETDLRELANRFAPLMLLPANEPSLPASVDWFLPKTRLTFRNSKCPIDTRDFGTPSLDKLEKAEVRSACGESIYRASGTRSKSRSTTFVLEDVDDEAKRGSSDPGDWITYFHAYKNTLNGLTIQYWSFYPFNEGLRAGPLDLGSHGGDWEMVSVVLDANESPVMVRMTGHTQMKMEAWSLVRKEGTHPIFRTERGAHEAHPIRMTDTGNEPYIRRPTWSGGVAQFPDGRRGTVGQLVDLGTKLRPKVGFLRYSGLWGSLGATPISSGYWGPAFNETAMLPNGFLIAWCDDVQEPELAVGNSRECYADDPQ